MAENVCPHCGKPLTDAQVISMIARYAASRRKTQTGGHNGGRPPKRTRVKLPNSLLPGVPIYR